MQITLPTNSDYPLLRVTVSHPLMETVTTLDSSHETVEVETYGIHDSEFLITAIFCGVDETPVPETMIVLQEAHDESPRPLEDGSGSEEPAQEHSQEDPAQASTEKEPVAEVLDKPLPR